MAERDGGADDVFLTGAGVTRRMSVAEINALFTSGDTNNDNKLTRGEFKILMSRMLHPRRGEGDAAGDGAASTSLTNDVLMATFVAQAIPFIGFGFMDNAIMILAGEYIEMKIGAAFALSTMAAAGLGNLISDIAGVGVSNHIEVMAERMGFRTPELTKAQQNTTGARMAKVLGAVIGITVGCLIGMFPLLFFDRDKEEEKKQAVNK